TRHGIETAIEGGIDVLTHTAPSAGFWPEVLIQRMLASNMAVIPTLKLWRYELERAGSPPAEVEAFQHQGVEQLRRFAAAGGEVLFGTDVGYMADDDPTEEYRKMHEAGLGFDGILAALTTAPTARFSGDEARTGRIEPGQPADLVILGSDPAKGPEAFADVRYTIRGGRVIYEADPARRGEQH
ncbi:MAG: amidohydrolase family protein, partial [Holophagales bacterium]|nr:amidohydrolase family protein [Holophagales bacterium]